MNTQVVTRDKLSNARRVLCIGISLALAASLSQAGPLTVTVLEAAPGSSRSAVELHTANCVEALRTRAIEAASADCERAVLAARFARLAATPFERAYGGGAYSIELAVAYSNRAVLYHLAGNTRAARADIATAAEFAPSADFVASNAAIIARPATEATAAR
jgi:hypothetical protein